MDEDHESYYCVLKMDIDGSFFVYAFNMEYCLKCCLKLSIIMWFLDVQSLI